MLNKAIAVCVASLLALAAEASQLVRLDVSQQGGVYEVHVEMEFDAPAETIRALLTDYENLDRLNRSITSSEVIASEQPDSVRVRTQVKNCILFFCTQLQKVEDVSEDADGRIITIIDPATSNFRAGTASWEIQDLGGHSRVIHHARLEPDLWIPPWIGTAILKDALRHGIRESFANLDCLAGASGRARLADDGQRERQDFSRI